LLDLIFQIIFLKNASRKEKEELLENSPFIEKFKDIREYYRIISTELNDGSIQEENDQNQQ
jgi:hypothetical protein